MLGRLDSVAKANPWLVAFVVSLATFMEVLDTTITNVSIRHIAGSFAAGQDESTWVLTSYLVANGIVLPLSGWLSGIMGRKRFFLTCIAGFTLASFLCGAATSLAGLILFRLLQGAAGGGLQPTQQAIILDYFPPEKRGQVFAITGITMIVAPILGPTLGGLITDNYSWRWIFYINIPVGIAAFLLVARYIEDPPHATARKAGSIDYIGLGLIGLGLGCLQVVLDKGQQEDWFASHFILLFATLTAVGIGGAIIWLLKQKDPVVDLRLMKDRSFATSCFLIFITGFVLYGGSALLPQLVQTHFGYDATWAGFVLSPGGMTLLFLMPVIGKLAHHFQARYLVALGFLLGALGMWHTAILTPQTDVQTFIEMRITQVIGLPLLFIPISMIAFQNIAKEQSSKASALFALFRNIGGSVGIAISIAIMTRHSQTRQHQLVEHLTPANPVYTETLKQAEAVTGSTHGALAMIYRWLIEQAVILAYIDTFVIMGGMMAFAGLIALLVLPRNNPHKADDSVAVH
jgi:DHA2 family multidrug resistance protein